MDNETSGLRFFSIGIVVEDKAVGTDQIKVNPIEHMTQLNGLLANVKIDYKINMPDARSVNQQDSITGQGWIPASWRALGDANRITSPDVYAGESVIILTMADTGIYYWDKLGTEPGIRRQETVQYSFSNLKAKGAAFDNDTSYWMKWDTRNKIVQMHTANNDGEPFKFDITIDAGNGSVVIQDDVGNFIKMDSANDLISLTSIAGANIDLDKGHIKGHGISIDLKSDTDINLTAGANINITAVAQIVMTAAKIVESGDVEIDGNVEHNGDEVHNGATEKNGDVTVEGETAITGATSIQGNLSTSGGDVTLAGGNITMTGSSITANGEDLTEDKIN